jgi:hypothetical protein
MYLNISFCLDISLRQVLYIISLGYKYKPLAIVSNYLSLINQTRNLTFWLRPPLRSRSRVDFDEFFGQAGLHQTT